MDLLLSPTIWQAISELQRLTKDDIKFACYDGYEEEFEAEAPYHTASFMSVRIKSKSTQWQGMPIYINGGKGTDCRRFGVHVLFKPGISQIWEGLIVWLYISMILFVWLHDFLSDCGCPISKLYYEIQPNAGI